MMTPSRLVVVSFVLLSLILMSWSKPISDDQIKRFFDILSRGNKDGSTEESTNDLTIDEIITAASKDAPNKSPDKDIVIIGKNQ